MSVVSTRGARPDVKLRTKFKLDRDALTYLNGKLNDLSRISTMHSFHPPKVCSHLLYLSFNVLVSTARSNPGRGRWP